MPDPPRRAEGVPERLPALEVSGAHRAVVPAGVLVVVDVPPLARVEHRGPLGVEIGNRG